MSDPIFDCLEAHANNPCLSSADPVIGQIAELNSKIRIGKGNTDPSVQEYLTAGVIIYNWQNSTFIHAHKITEAEGRAMHTAFAVITRVREAMAKSPHIRIHYLLNTVYGRSSV